MTGERKWVPDVLWRLSKGRALTLSETILRLVPAECTCKIRSKCKCLRCCFCDGSDDNPLSYLLRPDDPPDYRSLLNRCYLIVPRHAPPLPPEPLSGRRWSHLQIVRRTIERILVEQPQSSNVLCCGYDKLKDLSPNAKLLISSAWDLVSQRVGETIMSYLLCHASIFSPIPGGKYQQVAGAPVSGLITGFPRHISDPESWSGSVKKGSKRKRRGVNRDNSIHKKPSCVLSSQVDVPWRLSGGQALTLGETIVGLVPGKCFCKTGSKSKWKCLHCCFHGGSKDNPISYLLRPNDPDDYQILLNQSFVVIPENTPQLPPDSSSICRWSQFQIVRRTIETILAEQPRSSNVLCCGYDKFKDLSPNAKLLTSSAWDLVSQRVGEKIMSYLLLHTSIFFPIPCGKYQQVAGRPVRGLITEFPRHTSEPESPSFSVQPGSKRKRGRENGDNSSRKKLPCVLSSQTEGPQNSSGLSFPIEGTITSNSRQSERDEGLQTSDAKPKSRSRLRLPIRLRKRHKRFSSRDVIAGSLCTEPDKSTTAGSGHINSGHASEEHEGDQDALSQEDLSLCRCCSIFQTSLGVPKGAQIKSQSILYNLESSLNLLPEKHILNSLKLGFGATNHLMREIFALSSANCRTQPDPYSYGKGFQSHGSTCLYHSLLKLLKVLGHRAKHCRYEMLLDKHCPAPSSSDNELNMCYNSRNQVVSFIWAACRNIVPADLLGSSSCWRTMRRNISKFIQLRKFEKFTIKQCVSKLKMSKLPALSSKRYSCCRKGQMLGCGTRENARSRLRHKLFERWMFWFFSQIVAPIIQANFYVTESEHGKQELYFYRKSVWKKISDHAIVSLKEQSYSTLDNKSVRNILRNRPFGFSKLRFCPKEMGVRAIANLRAPSRICKLGTVVTDQCRGMQRKARPCPGNDHVFYLKSVNHGLRDMHSVFRVLRTEEPEYWGSSVFDYNDIYGKLCRFFMSVKNGMKSMPDIFIVVSDVKKAFDTVNQDKLLKIVDEILMRDEYHLQRSHEVACRKKSLWVYENLRLIEQQCSEMKASIPSRPRNTIVVDQDQSRNIRKKETYLYLVEHLKHNVLQFNKRFFLQSVGIPQGSVVSSLLCSLYFGHLERKIIFPFLKKGCEVGEASAVSQNKTFKTPNHTLLRFIDDFIFISTSRKQATSFFWRLQRGFREYNCYMNKDKFCLNFDIDNSSGLMSKRLVQGDDGISLIQWCGLLINCRTLEVHADYTRYQSNHLSSTLTVCWQGRPGRQLKGKLCDYMRPKCHPIFFDSNINSPPIVRLNVYQAFVLCAMKFHCYVRDLSSICKFQSQFYFKVIERSLRYMHNLIKKRMKSVTLSSDWKPVLHLAKEETMWLGRTAYTRVLKRKQSRHKDLLRLLRSKLAAQGDIGSCPWLKYAVDDSHSSLMWKLKF